MDEDRGEGGDDGVRGIRAVEEARRLGLTEG